MSPSAATEIVGVRVGTSELGIRVDGIREVLRPPPITRVPFMPPSLRGVTSLRGELLPVVDLGVCLGASPVAPPGRLLVVTDPRTGAAVGLLVDTISALGVLPHGAAEPPPEETAAALPARVLEGVAEFGGGVLGVLNLQRVLDAARSANQDEE